MAEELREIVAERYALIEHYRPLLAVIERCAAEMPELESAWFDMARAGSFEQLGSYLERNQPGSIAGHPQASRPQTTVTTDGPAPLPSVPRSDRVPVLVWVIAAVFVAVELAVSGRYGFQQDELYFIVAGHHLALGYVDQPPLAPLLTRITDILGVSPTAIRIIPALAGGAVVIMAKPENTPDDALETAVRAYLRLSDKVVAE